MRIKERQSSDFECKDTAILSTSIRSVIVRHNFCCNSLYSDKSVILVTKFD